MHDEYNGEVDSSGQTYVCRNFELESKEVLVEAQVRYNTYGRLNAKKDNVLVVCHALTGNSKLDVWWGSMLGDGKAFDTAKYLIVCANTLGSCYGSSGPMSINSVTGRLYGVTFPDVTIRDSVNIQIRMVKEDIGANSVFCVIGGSMGGMQALEWAILGRSFVKSCIVISCNAAHTAWQIAQSETQRQAIYADPKWNNGYFNFNDPPVKGLSLARQIAMVSYRTSVGYASKFGRQKDVSGMWQVRRYLEYQGKKILDRFDAITYVKLTEQLDSHDVGRDRDSIDSALSSIRCRVLVMGIDSDVLYPIQEQRDLASRIPGSLFYAITSTEGHDGFLLEQTQVGTQIQSFLNSATASGQYLDTPCTSTALDKTSHVDSKTNGITADATVETNITSIAAAVAVRHTL